MNTEWLLDFRGRISQSVSSTYNPFPKYKIKVSLYLVGQNQLISLDQLSRVQTSQGLNQSRFFVTLITQNECSIYELTENTKLDTLCLKYKYAQMAYSGVEPLMFHDSMCLGNCLYYEGFLLVLLIGCRDDKQVKPRFTTKSRAAHKILTILIFFKF